MLERGQVQENIRFPYFFSSFMIPVTGFSEIVLCFNILKVKSLYKFSNQLFSIILKGDVTFNESII